MHIVINQSNNVFGVDAENKIFAQSTETVTFDVTFSDPQATLQGLYCALLSDGGKTLALTTISDNKAVLDTNTIECVEYVAQWAIGTTRHAFIVVGESTKPLAIIDVEVAQNPLEGLMPPTESSPSYPTSAELQAILAEVNAQAKVASESAQSANQSAIFVNTAKTEVVRIGAQITTDKALIQGYASTASSGASRAEEAKRIAVNASEIVSEMQDEIGATKTKIDATAKVVQSNADAVAGAKTEIDGKLANANTAINEAVGKAETAKADAVKAQGEASKSATASATSATQAQEFADDAKASAVDTLKRKYWAEGLLYSDNYNGSLAELKLDLKAVAKLFNTSWIDMSYIYFQLWGEHKRWVLMVINHEKAYFMFLSLDAKTITHKVYIPSNVNITYTSAGTCLTNTHFWAVSNNDGKLYRYELATDTLTSVTTASLGVTIDDMYVSGCSTGIVPLANGDILYGAKYIIDKDTMTVVGEVALEECVTRNITSKTWNIRDYAFRNEADASSATPSPIYFLFMDGMPPLWIDDRWTTDADGKRVVTLRTIKTDDASIVLGTGASFGIATARGLSALVKGGSSVVRYMTIDTTKEASQIVRVTKAQSYTYSQTLPHAFCLSKGYTPAADVDARDSPHIVFKTGAMLAGYFGMKRGLGSGANTKAYEAAFVLPSSNRFKEGSYRGMHPGGSSEFFPLFGVTRYGTSVAITGGQYSNAN